MGRIAGRYTASRDGRIYAFDASWQPAGEGVIWSATVKRDRELVAAPRGQIRTTYALSVADDVQRQVERAIEALN
jgi:hypothetical protein